MKSVEENASISPIFSTLFHTSSHVNFACENWSPPIYILEAYSSVSVVTMAEKEDVKVDEVTFRDFALNLLKEFGELTTEDIKTYYKLREGKEITEKQIKEVLKADGRFEAKKDGKKTVWRIK